MTTNSSQLPTLEQMNRRKAMASALSNFALSQPSAHDQNWGNAVGRVLSAFAVRNLNKGIDKDQASIDSAKGQSAASQYGQAEQALGALQSLNQQSSQPAPAQDMGSIAAASAPQQAQQGPNPQQTDQMVPPPTPEQTDQIPVDPTVDPEEAKKKSRLFNL